MNFERKTILPSTLSATLPSTLYFKDKYENLHCVKSENTKRTLGSRFRKFIC